MAQLNIEHFRKLLATEQDVAKRLTLLRLLAEEEAKLASLRRRVQDFSCHSRQWLGRTSIRCLVSALIQLPRMRRH